MAAGAAHFPAPVARLLVSGGGRHNATLMAHLRAVMGCEVLPVEAVMRAALNNDPAQAGAIHRQIDALAQGCGQSATSLSGDQLYPRIRAAYAVVATSEPALFANVLLRKAALPPSNS